MQGIVIINTFKIANIYKYIVFHCVTKCLTKMSMFWGEISLVLIAVHVYFKVFVSFENV